MRCCQRAAQPSRERSRRTTPVCANSRQTTPRARHQRATARSRSYVQPGPVSSWLSRCVKPQPSRRRSKISGKGPQRTSSGRPRAASAARNSASAASTQATCRGWHSGLASHAGSST